jgi:peptidoglycan/LPS O-acetylase OafA/YrhL
VKLASWLNQIPEKLGRVSSRNKVISEIDGLRFLAAFPVVIQHLSERVVRNLNVDYVQGKEFFISSFLTSRGFVGVYIFFIVSGFIMAFPFANHYLFGKPMSGTLEYYKNRFSRLIPPYALALTALFLLLLVINYYPKLELWRHYLASLFFLHNTVYNGWSPINPTIWTLEIQVQFYCCLPLIAWLVYRFRSTWGRRIVVVIAILALHVIQDRSGMLFDWGYLNIIGNLQYFLVGMLLADLYLIEWSGGVVRSKIFDLVAVVAITCALFAWNWDHNIYSRLLFLALLFVFFYAMFRSVWINRFLANRWVMALGSMCFTIYLVHLPLAEFFIIFSKHIHFTNYLSINMLIQVMLYLPLLIGASVVYFLLIEKPTMKKDWPRRLAEFFGLKSYEERKLGNEA